ncbi:hypothetical protein HOE67_01585 [Candidatus Peregrinibacteria bacterium]|jgi:hypothetical protein|nr:hypothetical protein [Candidatus Peregrinibacteria bacterium]MBT4055779.1 hypothetical protein [Candidatus Peregrinibacteria bacterium]
MKWLITVLCVTFVATTINPQPASAEDCTIEDCCKKIGWCYAANAKLRDANARLDERLKAAQLEITRLKQELAAARAHTCPVVAASTCVCPDPDTLKVVIDLREQLSAAQKLESELHGQLEDAKEVETGLRADLIRNTALLLQAERELEKASPGPVAVGVSFFGVHVGRDAGKCRDSPWFPMRGDLTLALEIDAHEGDDGLNLIIPIKVVTGILQPPSGDAKYNWHLGVRTGIRLAWKYLYVQPELGGFGSFNENHRAGWFELGVHGGLNLNNLRIGPAVFGAHQGPYGTVRWPGFFGLNLEVNP